MCSHHEVKKQSPKTSCHGVVHAAVEIAETPTSGDSVDVDCVCFVNQTPPYVASKSENKKSKAANEVAESAKVSSAPVFGSANIVVSAVPEFDGDLSYSYALKSLLPARAPPRL